MTPDERRARGIRTRLFLDSAEVRSAFDEVERDLIAEWRKALLPRTRERKWAELKGLERLKSRLASYAGQAPRQ